MAILLEDRINERFGIRQDRVIVLICKLFWAFELGLVVEASFSSFVDHAVVIIEVLIGVVRRFWELAYIILGNFRS
ncbi:MAG: hypothetical protein NT022_13295 [Deltaproteobacteria bacterium]|nr:hypothetical protein [Deltaproteobacteria bacterium]